MGASLRNESEIGARDTLVASLLTATQSPAKTVDEHGHLRIGRTLSVLCEQVEDASRAFSREAYARNEAPERMLIRLKEILKATLPRLHRDSVLQRILIRESLAAYFSAVH